MTGSGAPTSNRSVVVVGAGVIGTACAHFLRQRGWSVRLIDRGRFGGGCSHGNCGFVCPSHVLPMAEPGAIRSALRAMLRPNAPFRIKPRLSPGLWSWLLRFARRCNPHDQLESGRAIQPLLESSMALYRDLVNRQGLECDWESRGLLFVFRDAVGMNAYAETDRLLAGSFGHPAERFDGDRLTELEPALRPGLAGGWYYRGDAHLRSDRLLTSWRRRLESDGVVVSEQVEMLGLARREGRAVAVETRSGPIEADAFVIAAGAWTGRMGRALGVAVPIQPGKGYSMTMPRPAVCPAIPMIFPETRVAATPWRSGYRLGSMMEFAGFDPSIRPRRLHLLRAGAEPFLREPYCEPVLEKWFGWRPMTYDSVPIIGPSPAMANVMVAAGHNMLGLSMAPATGRLVAELLSGEAPHVDARPYAASRFRPSGTR